MARAAVGRTTRPPRKAGDAFGRVLAYLDDSTLALWSEAAGIRLSLSRWYARMFGFPELAAHRRFGPVRDMLRRHGGETVLDLGAGNGLYSVADAINRPGTIHVLADVSLRHMRRATATGRSLELPVWGIACSAPALPLATESLDTVLLIEVLQFLDEDRAAIGEIARVLRPGGVWVCEQEHSPLRGSLGSNPEARLQKRRFGYEPGALRELAAGAGLILEDSQIVSGGIGRRWELLDGRIFGRSRLLHSVLFPVNRALSWLLSPPAVDGKPGTVLYLFRKARGNAPVAATS